MPEPAPIAQAKVVRFDPWKEDGNVVLAAEGNYFRVHRSVLSAYSEVFKDMFDCPPPNEAEEEFIEHCPVVHLQDAATDVQVMLKAMYDRSFPASFYEKMPISVVSAFLHLGDKYAIPTFTKEAKAKLCCNSDPTSMSTTSFMMPSCTTKLFPAITDSDPYNFQVMNLLQELGLKAPLPIAMYQCITTCPLRNIVDGYRVNGSFYSLSPANLRSFILMKNVFENYRVRLAKSLCRSPSCIQLSCEHNIRLLWSEDIGVQQLGHWRSRWDELFCETCKSSLKARREAEMKQVWHLIPTAFGFHSWEDVKKSGDFPRFML